MEGTPNVSGLPGNSAETDNPIVFVPSSDSENEDSDTSVQITTPYFERNKRARMENGDGDFRFLGAVIDASRSIDKMVHIQAELVKTLQGISDKMDVLVQTIGDISKPSKVDKSQGNDGSSNLDKPNKENPKTKDAPVEDEESQGEKSPGKRGPPKRKVTEKKVEEKNPTPKNSPKKKSK